jgi:hypothetical protein
MTTKKLTIKGITFPNFVGDDSKKNFRLVFHIGYKDKDGKDVVDIVSTPSSGHWQWKKSTKDAFLQPTVVGNSAKLDVGMLKLGDGKKIPAGSDLIANIEGDIEAFSVQFMDVQDATPLDFLVKNVLPQLITAWQASGFNPIDSAPIPGGIKVILKDKVDLDKLVASTMAYFTKQLQDKVLHTISQDYNGENPLAISQDDVPWGKGKKGGKGTYGVTIGFA